MEFGLALPSSPEMAEEVAPHAEDLGFDALWFYDSPLCYSDPFMMMALAARKTSRIQLGTGVAIAGMREPQILATCVGTLNQLAPGRTVLTLATGHSAVGTMGRPQMKWARVVEDVRICRALVSGREVEAEFDGRSRPIRHLHPRKGYVNCEDRVPIYTAATGPRGTEISADLADGMFTAVPGGRPTPEALAARVGHARERALARGATSFPVVLLTAIGVKDDPNEPSNSDRLSRLLGPWAMAQFHGHAGVPTGEYAVPAIQKAADAVRRTEPDLRPDAPWLDLFDGHAIYVRDAERGVVTAELLEEVAMVGTAEELRGQIRGLEGAGITQIVWQVIPGLESEMDRFATAVMEPYRCAA